MTGEEDYTAGVNWIRERYQIPLILVSMGKEGSRAYYNGTMVEVKPERNADFCKCGSICDYNKKRDTARNADKR